MASQAIIEDGVCCDQSLQDTQTPLQLAVTLWGFSIAAAKKTTFLENWYSMGAKIVKITKLFCKVEHLRNWGITYWAERSGLPGFF